MTPEKRLLAALVLQAMNEAYGGINSECYVTKWDKARAKRWLTVEDSGAWSYRWCLEQLGISHKEISRLNMVKLTKERMGYVY